MTSTKLKFIMPRLAVTLIATLTTAFALAGGDGSGGGSGIAAEITRATDTFIEAVKNNPEIFKGLDAQVLQNLKPQILVTSHPIIICKNLGELEAWSDRAQGYSKFNFSAWLNKDELAKVQLAGHERLVFAGLENSNRYEISNKIYEVEIKDLEKRYGPAKDICDFGASACRRMHEIDADIATLVNATSKGDLRDDMPAYFLASKKDIIESEILLRIGLKQISLNRGFFNFKNPDLVLTDYNNQVRLAYNKHFNPMLNEAQKLINKMTTKNSTDDTCVNIN